MQLAAVILSSQQGARVAGPGGGSYGFLAASTPAPREPVAEGRSGSVVGFLATGGFSQAKAAVRPCQPSFGFANPSGVRAKARWRPCAGRR